MSEEDIVEADHREGLDEPEEQGLRWWQPPSAVQAVAMVAALLFLGGVIGTALANDDVPLLHRTSVDEGFAQDMIVHHDQGLSIAGIALQRAEEAPTKHAATEVLIFQAREVGVMQTWLKDWGVAEDGDRRTGMGWMGVPTKLENMPGMASKADLGRLGRAEGVEADRLFYVLMIAHHRGAIHMADYAAKHAKEPRVRDLAEVIARSQAVEIREYQVALGRLGR
jgi:uncharacterized protein (DUF305 family)